MVYTKIWNADQENGVENLEVVESLKALMFGLICGASGYMAG